MISRHCDHARPPSICCVSATRGGSCRARWTAALATGEGNGGVHRKERVVSMDTTGSAVGERLSSPINDKPTVRSRKTHDRDHVRRKSPHVPYHHDLARPPSIRRVGAGACRRREERARCWVTERRWLEGEECSRNALFA